MNPIVGIGEVLWDMFPDGRKVAGGAPFNFAFHCHQLGHPAAIVSRVGDDELGRELRDEVRRLGLSDEYIQTDPEHPTGTVRVTVDAAGQPSYTITENVAWDYIAWDERLEALAPIAKVVCFGTLAQRSAASRSTIQALIAAAGGALKVFDVNLRGSLADETPWLIFEELRRTNWLKLNETELGIVFGELAFHGALARDGWQVSRKESHVRLLFNPTEPGKVGILTRGEKSTAVTDWQRTEWVPAVPAAVVDTVGAGDSFTAAMVCLHLEGRPLRECVRFANHYAARVCEHRGATPCIDRAEVERAAFAAG